MLNVNNYTDKNSAINGYHKLETIEYIVYGHLFFFYQESKNLFDT